MASIWKLNGGDIYVGDYREGLNPTIAEHNPIASVQASIYHFIFEPDDEITIEGYVVGLGHLNTIKGGIRTNVTLITDLIPGGVTVLLQQLDITRDQTSCQLIDPSLAADSPVYKVVATLRS